MGHLKSPDISAIVFIIMVALLSAIILYGVFVRVPEYRREREAKDQCILAHKDVPSVVEYCEVLLRHGEK